MAIIDKIKDKAGNIVYPISTVNAVYAEDSKRLDVSLTDICKNIADIYSNTETYSIDERCIYEELLYKCVTAITVPEEFNPDHWTPDCIADDIYKMNTAKVIYTSNLNDLPPGLTWCSAAATNVPVANSGYCFVNVGIAGYKSQIYVTNTTRRMFIRAMAGTVWGGWLEVPFLTNGSVPLDAFTRKNTVTPFVGDIRTLTAGVTWCSDTCTNLPVAEFGYAIVTASNTTQTGLNIEFRGIDTNCVWMCNLVDSVWSPWVKIGSPRESGSPSVTIGANCSFITVLAERSANICHISADINATAALSSNAIIATLPVGYRPATGFFAPCTIANNANMKSSFVKVMNTGTINIQDAMTLGSYMIFDSTFILP